MHQSFDDKANVLVTRDDEGTVREVLHLEDPFVTSAGTALLAAGEYLEKFGLALDIAPRELNNFSLAPEVEPMPNAGVEYRFSQEKTQFDTTTVVFEQTYAGLPVYEAGVAVNMRRNPFAVFSAQSTRHAHIDVALPFEKALARIRKLDAKSMSAPLGLRETKECDPASFELVSQRLVIYRFDEKRRTHVEPPAKAQTQAADALRHPPPPSLPLPPIPTTLDVGVHYVAAEVIFRLTCRDIRRLAWRAIIDVETLLVLYLRPLIDDVSGLVFREDPVTANGGPLPNATAAQLNALRSSQLLHGLDPPVGGTYSLAGDNVRLQEMSAPPIPTPTEPAGTNYDFNARTDNFAAVNAYYHCDRFFRLVKDLGFDLPTYFTGTLFPSFVDHRGHYGTLNGIEVNAYCAGNGTFGIDHTAFMLADTGDVINPMGLSCDWRVVLHELGGHGILYNHVNSANFNFAHSAGDSFAAVLNDPETHAPDRFVTFPWVDAVIGRRHDRDVAAGWAWGGINDGGGYDSEQILCTTHFRLYRSIGGDAAEIATRQFAARYVAYLMLRAIGSLTQATNPNNPALYAATLMSAEIGNWTSEDQVGGVYYKVIRWAFEKQGLFQLPGAPVPVTQEGAPPIVDVYIDDGRAGQYQFQPSFWETADIWNRHAADGGLEHQTPHRCEKNYAYVRVKSRGLFPARAVRVNGYHAPPAAGLVWPDDFEAMTTASLTVPVPLASGAPIVVGPFEWTPVHDDHECMLMAVSALGDSANIHAPFLPSAAGPTPAWRLVPSDNNIALRSMVSLPGATGRCALEAHFCNRVIRAQNPFNQSARIKVDVVMAPFLASRGWLMVFDHADFTLGPRASREVRPTLLSGREFSAAELAANGATAIVIRVLANGIVVGGFTYLLDPVLGNPQDARKCCCEPCVDDRCKRCCCWPPPCDKREDPECEAEPCHAPKERCRKGPRRMRVEIELDPCECSDDKDDDDACRESSSRESASQIPDVARSR